MKPHLCSALLLLTISLNAQAPVPLAHGDVPGEPHHHLKIENQYVRAYYVEVPPHEDTLLHQHDHDYLFVTLGDTEVINAVLGKPEVKLALKDGEVRFTRGGFAHVARNLGDKPFRNVTIELLKPQGEPYNLCAQIVAGALSGPCDKNRVDGLKSVFAAPQFETTQMKLDSVRIDPKTKSHEALRVASLIVVLDNSEVQVEVKGKPPKTLHSGETVWLEARSSADISNLTEKPSKYFQLYFEEDGKSVKP